MLKKFLFLTGIFMLLMIRGNSQGLFESALENIDSARSENLSVGGFVRSVLYAGKNYNDDPYLQSLYSQMGIITGVNAGKMGNAYAEMRLRKGNEFSMPLTSLELREAYVNLYLGPLYIKAGKQIMSWGSTSFINPSDHSAPSDPTNRSPIEDDLRLGTWAVQADLIITNSTSLQFVWMPQHVASQLLTDAFDFPAYLEFRNAASLPLTLENSGFKFNYDVRTGLLDMSLSFYHGYRNNPSVLADTALFDIMTMQPQNIILAKEPYKINSAGFNTTIPIGNYLIRAEAGWLQPVEDADATYTLPEISYTAEIEQSGSNITIIAGYYGKYILDFEKMDIDITGITEGFPGPAEIFPPGTTPDIGLVNEYIDQQIEGFNRLYNYQAREFYHSVYASLSVNLFNELLKLDIPGMYCFTSNELTLMPSMKFDIADGLSARLGGYYLHGKDNSLYTLAGPKLNAAYIMLDLKF